MSEDCLKLTIYFGERDRTSGRFLADRLLDICEEHRLRLSLLTRGVEGFGVKHHLHTDRLLTLSEDLPLVAVAVDRRPKIEAALARIDELSFDGLVTLERARLLDGRNDPGPLLGAMNEAAKLTLYLGRGARAGGRPPHESAVDMLRRGGLDGATVLLGVDGTLDGARRRARFFSANAEVPVMVISTGPSGLIGRVIPELRAALDEPLMTLERVQVLKRDGEIVADLEQLPDSDERGMSLWRKLMLYSSEQARFGGHPVHVEAIRRLRREGAPGATALRGVWGFDGLHDPHGDAFWRLRRSVPTLTVVVDAPSRSRRWLAVLDEITPERGLITSEVVPAFRATGPDIRHGGLRLANRREG